MKKPAVDLKSLKKEINALGKKLDQLSKKADKLMQAQKTSKAKPKAAAKGKAKPKAKAKAAPKAAAKTAKNAAAETPTDQVLKMMKRYKKGVNIAKLKELTGFNDKQISNIVHRASKKGKLERVERGVYKLA